MGPRIVSHNVVNEAADQWKRGYVHASRWTDIIWTWTSAKLKPVFQSHQQSTEENALSLSFASLPSQLFTSSSAVAERSRDASWLSVVSLNSTKRRTQSSVVSYFRFRFTAAGVQLNSVLFSSLWSSMLVVINKDSLMRGGVCGTLHGGRSQLLFALQQLSIDSQLFVDNLDVCLSHLHSTPRWGPLRNIVMTFGMEKLEWCEYPTVKKFEDIFFSYWKVHERDRQTDGRTDRHRMTAQAALASCGKKQKPNKVSKSDETRKVE